MDETDFLIEQLRMVISRLERISADSTWARRSSGQRGALLRWLDLLNSRKQAVISGSSHSRSSLLSTTEAENLRRALQAGFELLERAAREFPERD